MEDNASDTSHQIKEYKPELHTSTILQCMSKQRKKNRLKHHKSFKITKAGYNRFKSPNITLILYVQKWVQNKTQNDDIL